MPFVPARCPSCGAQLTVDNAKEAAVCEYCNTLYIAEKAIHNYHIFGNNSFSVNSAVIHVQEAPSAYILLQRAAEYENANNINLALAYYKHVLDIDFENIIARKAVERLDHKVIAKIPVTGGFVPGTLTLYKKELVYSTKQKRKVYPVNTIISVHRFIARLTIKLSTKRFPLEFAVGSPSNAKLMEKAIKLLLSNQQ